VEQNVFAMAVMIMMLAFCVLIIAVFFVKKTFYGQIHHEIAQQVHKGVGDYVQMGDIKTGQEIEL